MTSRKLFKVNGTHESHPTVSGLKRGRVELIVQKYHHSKLVNFLYSANKIEVAADWVAFKYMWVQLGYTLRRAAPT